MFIKFKLKIKNSTTKINNGLQHTEFQNILNLKT